MSQVVARYVPPGHINLASFDTIGGGRVAEENWRYLGRYLRKKGFGVSAKEFRALSSAGNSKLHKGDIVLFRYDRYGPYQQGKVLDTEYDEGTDWVKLLCTAEEEEHNTNLSDPNIVPLLPRAS